MRKLDAWCMGLGLALSLIAVKPAEAYQVLNTMSNTELSGYQLSVRSANSSAQLRKERWGILAFLEKGLSLLAVPAYADASGSAVEGWRNNVNMGSAADTSAGRARAGWYACINQGQNQDVYGVGVLHSVCGQGNIAVCAANSIDSICNDTGINVACTTAGCKDYGWNGCSANNGGPGDGVANGTTTCYCNGASLTGC